MSIQDYFACGLEEQESFCSHTPEERIIYCPGCKPTSTVLKRRVDELKTLLEAKDMRIAKLEFEIDCYNDALSSAPEAADSLKTEIEQWKSACKNESKQCSKHQAIAVEIGEERDLLKTENEKLNEVLDRLGDETTLSYSETVLYSDRLELKTRAEYARTRGSGDD